MKSILAVLVLFGLFSLAIGVYFVTRSQSTQTSIQAAPQTDVLGNIMQDCDYLMLENCDEPSNESSLLVVPREVEKVLRTHALPSIVSFREPVDVSTFTKLGQPVSLPLQATYSTADIIARISLGSQVDYKLLIAVFAVQGQKAWDGEVSMSNAFGRRELSFAEQLAAVALELRSEFQSQSTLPTNSVTNAGTNYPFDKTYVSTASRSVYAYFARTSSPEKFKQVISLSPTEERSFDRIWFTLFSK